MTSLFILNIVSAVVNVACVVFWLVKNWQWNRALRREREELKRRGFFDEPRSE